MKKLMLAIVALTLATGAVIAAQGIYNLQTDNLTVSTSLSLPSGTTTQISTLTPGTTGQLLYCTNCASANVCVSTGVAAGGWASVTSTTTACH